MDFRAQPSFHCRNCGVSASCFEALILHNAKTHPGTGLAGSPLSTSLRVSQRDGTTVVEQNLHPEAADDSGNSVINTAINKISATMASQGKEEHKRVAVSQSGEVPRAHLSSNKHVEIRESSLLAYMQTAALNGSLRRPSGQPAMQMFSGASTYSGHKSQKRGLPRPTFTTPVNPPNSSLPLNAFPPSDPNNNLPKVMIPLSSIPAYDAAMDASSFLKTSFSKFPYPTKAELCYLTVVSDFPEEQIKLWFTAQRLKKGISWSPEEIEDTRRRMFNTIFQPTPDGTQKQQVPGVTPQPRTVTHSVTVGPNIRTPQIPQGLVSRWKPGVIVNQSHLIPRPPPTKTQSVVRTTVGHLQPRAATSTIFEAMNSSLPTTGQTCSSSSISSNISHTSVHQQAGHFNTKLPESLTRGSSLSKNDVNSIAVVSDISDYRTPSISNSSSLSMTPSNGSTSALNTIYSNNFCIRNTSPTSKVSSYKPNTNGGICRQSESPSHPNDSSNASISNSDTSTSPLRTSNTENSDISNHTSKFSENTNISPLNSNESEVIPTPPPPPVQLHCPIQPSGPLEYPLSKVIMPQEEQFEVLKKSFVHCQFPDQNEIEKLMSATGLSMREVCTWFSDNRYLDSNMDESQSSQELPLKDVSVSSSVISPTDMSNQSVLRNGATSQATLSPPPSTLLKSQVQVLSTLHRGSHIPSPDLVNVQYKENDPLQLIALEESFCQEPQPSEIKVDHLPAKTKMTPVEIQHWFSERHSKRASPKQDEEDKRNVDKSVVYAPPTSTNEGGQFETEVIVGPGQSIKEPYTMDKEAQEGKRESPEPKVNPIKINLKMLKVSDPEGKHGLVVMSSEQEPDFSRMLSAPSSLVYERISPDQMHVLRKAFASSPWPNNQQLDELVLITGLHKSDVVRWFSDCRRIHKNGQLPWLNTYQNTDSRVWFAEEDNRNNIKGHTETQYDNKTNFMRQDLARGLSTADGLRREPSNMLEEGAPRYLSSLLQSGEAEALAGRDEAYELKRAAMPLQDPWLVKGGGEHQQPIDGQSFREHQTQDKQPRDSLRRELLKHT